MNGRSMSYLYDIYYFTFQTSRVHLIIYICYVLLVVCLDVCKKQATCQVIRCIMKRGDFVVMIAW